MKAYPLWLRAGWSLSGLLLAASVLLPLGPTIEGKLFPIRTGQHVDPMSIQRFPTIFRFVWDNDKRRQMEFIDIDVALENRRNELLVDRFVVTLFRDESAKGEAPCSRIVPWSHSGQVGIGPHHQPFCVEIPRTVKANEHLTLTTVIRYRGFLGLWHLPVTMPEVEVPDLAKTSQP